MKVFIYIFIPIIMFGLNLAGCDADKDNPVRPESAFTMNEFPMDVNTRWKYSVQDTIAGIFDTIDVLIFDSTRFPDSHYATVWFFEGYENSYGRDCVSIFGDTLKFFHDRSSVADRYLVFPIDVGKRWEFDHTIGFDSVLVVAKESINVPFGELTAYHIHSETYPRVMDAFRHSDIWLAPGIGLIRADYASGTLAGEHHETRELIEFLPPKEQYQFP